MSRLREEDWDWIELCQHQRGPYSIDLMGFGDVFALDAERRPLVVQATTGDHVMERVRKILELPTPHLWLHWGRIEVWGWRRLKGKTGYHERRLRFFLKSGSLKWEEKKRPFL